MSIFRENLMKNSVGDLAVFGGLPAFQVPLHVGRPNIGDRGRLLGRFNQILDSRWFTNDGPFIREFEQRIADMVGVQHCVAMCNGTVALEIAIRALGMKGEVIIPSFTFIATAHALQWQGITPVFCDIEPQTCTLDPKKVEQAITPRTTGIIGVHVWGHTCDIDALSEIAARRRLKLLFDSAHAFACSYKGKMIGNFGDAEVFSFHATKFFNTFEGGAIVTNNDELARKVRLMRNFGFTGYDEVSYLGTNGKMNEMSATMGLTSLESLDEFIAVNRRNYLCYREQLQHVCGVRVVPYDETDRCNYQYIALDLDEALTQTVSRDELWRILSAENIMARRYFYPGCHRMEPYRSLFPEAGRLLPETERLTERVLCLPTGTTIEESDIKFICQLLKLIVQNADEVRQRLRAPGANSVSSGSSQR
jgi:dTDP-4-amino-4,6-dideoxygalactose transaminase